MNFLAQQPYLKVQDHTVSNQEFTLLLDSDLQLLKTHPQPQLQDLGKYYQSDDYISHTDSKRSVFEKMYHLVKKYSLHKKIKLIQSLQPQKGMLLDIGAGTGDFLALAQKQGWSAIGIEPNQKAKKLAQAKAVQFKDNTQALPDHQFDVITLWHVLEHVPDIENQIQEIKRLLKPSGTIIIAVPNFKSYDAQYYNKFWAAYDVPRHLWHFSKTSIQKIFKDHSIKLIKTKPMIFDSFYVSLLSEKNKNKKINYIKAFCIGLLSNVKALQTKEYSSHIYILKNY